MVILQCFSSQVFVALQLFVMQSTLSAFVVGGGAKRRAELVEETSLEWRRAQTARLLLPWPRVRSRRVGRPSGSAEWCTVSVSSVQDTICQDTICQDTICSRHDLFKTQSVQDTFHDA